MSRSRLKHPFSGWTKKESEKQYKEKSRRAHRRATHVAVEKDEDPPSGRLFGDRWNGPKDGRQRFKKPFPAKWMRK